MLYGRGIGDYFDALAVSERSLHFSIETPELLRVPDNRRQGRRQDELLESVRSQVVAQMRESKRRAFRGEVSIELTIFAGAGPTPSAPKSVKRYLDALQGLVYSDDHQVGHLQVARFAEDHPARQRAARAAVTVPLATGTARETCTVYVTVLPLRLYVANYARLFSTGHVEEVRERRLLRDDAHGHRLADELEELYGERRQEQRGEPVGARNADLERVLRDFREERIRELQTSLVLQGRLDPGDRPGPDRDAELQELFHRAGLTEPARLFDSRVDIPDTIWLPRLLTRSTGGAQNWAGLVAEHFEAHRQQWRMFPPAFEEPLALDIAIFGAPATTHDVDNVAHTVLKAFERIYCADNRGTVTTYRVYRRSSDEPAVRVKLMAADTLRELDGAMGEARENVLEMGLEEA